MPESVFTFKDHELTFSPENDLGISQLRHIKNWYGKELGSYSGLTGAAAIGDPDAIACVIWIAMRKRGLPTPEPMRLPDFPVGKLLGSFVVDGQKLHQDFPVAHISIDGVIYKLDIENIPASVFRAIKSWYPEFGNLVNFTMGIFKGDPDAVACCAWVVRNIAGEQNVPRPQDMDFSVGEVMDSYDFDEPVLPTPPEPPKFKEDQVEVDPPQPSDGASYSEGTLNNSGGSGTPKSPISSISRPRSKKLAPSLST